MRTKLRTAALLAIAGAVMAATVGPAAAAEVPAAAPAASWQPDLTSGEAAGVDASGGTARLDTAHAFQAPAEDSGGAEGGPAVPTGLLTLAPHRIATATDRVATTVLADLPAGSTATVDVRGMRGNGGWSEWIPATQTAAGTVAELPEPASDVQGRLVLTGGTAGAAAAPTVRSVTLTALAPDQTEGKRATEDAPANFRVFATREGLVGGTTANGHVIADRDLFVALPSRRALSPRDKSDYSVKVCAPSGRCAFAPVWDVGPWNTRDDYWNPAPQRQEWTDLAQGLPQAQAAFTNNYNGGKDQYDRKVVNPAGIDLGDGMFWDALGLTNNSWVTVDYLWTGSVRLSKVVADNTVSVRSAPDPQAKVVGVAASRAAVPVECSPAATATVAAGSWLRIGTGQFIEADTVDHQAPVPACATGPGPAAP
ncbi:hypothetical protein [Pseudonocardia sp. GCM10023141]|uniref:hypothetical protein n=1 Tax=Pseudonocardia sp. GCM10023141 TaxID=3252653 RepID=UPI00360BE92C